MCTWVGGGGDGVRTACEREAGCTRVGSGTCMCHTRLSEPVARDEGGQSEGGRGGAGTPFLPGFAYGPCRRGAENLFISILLAPKRPKENFRCRPQTFEGRRGVQGVGGVTPPPPTAYGRSNTSLPMAHALHIIDNHLHIMRHDGVLRRGGRTIEESHGALSDFVAISVFPHQHFSAVNDRG